MSRVLLLVNSVFLSSGDGDLGLPLKVQPRESGLVRCPGHESLHSSRVIKVSGLPVEFRWGPGLLQEDQQRESGLSSCCGDPLSVPLELLQGFRTYLKLSGNSVSFFL